jgi:TonB family protein
MYFDFEDYRPDITPLGRAISWREGVLLSVILHLAFVIVLLIWPEAFFTDPANAPAHVAAVTPERDEPPPRFVFVEPRVDTPAPKPPPRGEASDQDRVARAPERSPSPSNPLPFSRGDTSERVERMTPEVARGQGPSPEPSDAQRGEMPTPQSQSELRLPEAQTALQLPQERPPGAADRMGSRLNTPGGSLGDALRNLERYVQNQQFENPSGGGGAFGPAIQFDTKGVEFGPWIRRFVAQVKRNWLIPIAAMSMKGNVVITFNVHKNGFITDLSVVRPSPIDAFNNSAYGALSASNPTAPLPPEYPADKAFFTVTFFYNEEPPR